MGENIWNGWLFSPIGYMEIPMIQGSEMLEELDFVKKHVITKPIKNLRFEWVLPSAIIKTQSFSQ